MGSSTGAVLSAALLKIYDGILDSRVPKPAESMTEETQLIKEGLSVLLSCSISAKQTAFEG